MPQEAVKITCSTEDLDAKLSKSMKELGAHHDQYGRLLNAQNQMIGGLSQARVKLGDWIDAQGRARDANGNFLDGLTATELKLRFFKDAVGNVYTAEGELVRISEELTAQQKAEAEAAEQAAAAAKALEEQEKKLADAKAKEAAIVNQGINTLVQFTDALGRTNTAAGKLIAGIGQLGGSIAGSVQSISSAEKSLAEASAAAAKAGTAVSGMTVAATRAMQVFAALQVGIAAFNLTSKLFQKAQERTPQIVQIERESIDSLSLAYERLGTSAKNATKEQAAGAGFLAGTVTQADEVRAKLQEISDLEGKAKAAGNKVSGAQNRVNKINAEQTSESDNFLKVFWKEYMKQTSGAQEAAAHAGERLSQAIAENAAAQKALEDAKKEYSAAVSSMVSADLPADDVSRELKELQSRAAFYAEAIQSGNLEQEALTQAQKALEENQRKQAEVVAEQARKEAEAKGYGDLIKEKGPADPMEGIRTLDEASKKFAADLGAGSDLYNRAMENAAEALEKRAEQEREAAEKALGDSFDSYADGSALMTAEQKAAADMEATIRTWKENFAAAGRTQEELDAAIVNLKQEYEEKRLNEYLDRNSLKAKQTEKLSALDQYNQTLDKIREAEETYGLKAADAEKLRAQAAEDYAGALKKKADEEQKAKDSRLNELGITGLRDSMKSPFQKFLEQQQKVMTAAQEGLISAAEAQAMNGKLAEDYMKENRGEPGAVDGQFEREEYKAATTLTAGSNDLYKAMTQREGTQERYQNGVTKNLDNMNRYTEENNAALTAIQSQLADVMKAVGVV